MAGAVVTFRPPLTYDAEWHIGLQPDDPSESVATYNTTTLNAALAAMRVDGSFAFNRGSAGPVICPISFAGKEFFFKGPILTTPRTVGGLIGSFSRETLQPETSFLQESTLASRSSRLTRIDGDEAGPVIRVRGGSFTIDGFTIKGRRHTAADTYSGTRSGSCIEIEGRTAPATNYTLIRNCCLAEAISGIRTLSGFYNDANMFVADDNGAAAGRGQSLVVSGVENVFYSQNSQSRGWEFDGLRVSQPDDTALTVFNLDRGGCLAANNVWLQHDKVTLFSVNNYLTTNSRLSCDNLLWDNYTDADDYFTLFKYAGGATDGSALKWQTRISGLFNSDPTAPGYDVSKLIQIPAEALNFPTDELLFDIANLPTTAALYAVDGGPWRQPPPPGGYLFSSAVANLVKKLIVTANATYAARFNGDVLASALRIQATGNPTYGAYFASTVRASELNVQLTGTPTNGVYFGGTLSGNKITLQGPTTASIRWPDGTTGTFETPNTPLDVDSNNQVQTFTY